MDINKTIGYKPDLHYTDEYLSDASNYFKENNDNDLTLEEDAIDDLIEEGTDIENLIDKLPDNLSDIIDEVFDHVNDFIENELKDKELERVPVEIE
ncbi:hypothetical protein [Paraclostridium dentum]|uniref:hypothetical protein n=1 Tax=Paraclostridium dentum TaxID=2662455 RepID=UPI003F354415